MAWDIATARLVSGASPTVPDAALQRALDTVLSLVERLLGRGLFLRRETLRFYEVRSDLFFLNRYPIVEVHAVNGVPPGYCTRIHHCSGYVRLPCGNHPCRTVEIDYTGGYPDLPPDLEAALWEAFLFYWGLLDQQTGLPVPGGGATVTTGSGAVERVTLSDFGSVSFDVGTTVSNASSKAATGSTADYWGWLAPWASILNLYRHWVVTDPLAG